MGRAKSITVRMSRLEYKDLFVEPRRKPNKAERRVMWDRLAKRYLRGKGLIGPKIPTNWTWILDEQIGTVIGHTRSEARSNIKKVLGIKPKNRLPVGIIIEKDLNDDKPASEGTVSSG